MTEASGQKCRKESFWREDFHDSRALQWISVWHQAREALLKDDVASVLEIGLGRGINKALLEHFGLRHVGVDVQPQFEPDHLSTLDTFQTDERFDLVCAFQMLEHNPVETLPDHLRRMASFSNKYVYISVPYSGRWISVNLNVNWWRWAFTRNWSWYFNRAEPKVRPLEEYRKRPDKHNPHWWEVGDRDFSKERMREVVAESGLRIEKEFHNDYFPYHLFYLLVK